MSTLHQTVGCSATLASEPGAIQSAPMSEKLLRLERLIAVLDARNVKSPERAKYLLDNVGGAQLSQWSDLVHGNKSFGDKLARRIEAALGLVAGTLEEYGLPPDTSTLASAFNALPTATTEQLDVRKTLYTSIMAMIDAHRPGVASTPAPGPVQPPSGAPHRHS